MCCALKQYICRVSLVAELMLMELVGALGKYVGQPYLATRMNEQQYIFQVVLVVMFLLVIAYKSDVKIALANSIWPIASSASLSQRLL